MRASRRWLFPSKPSPLVGCSIILVKTLLEIGSAAKKNDLSAQVQIRMKFQWSENFVDKQHNEDTYENEILIFVADDKWITNKMEWSRITYLFKYVVM